MLADGVAFPPKATTDTQSRGRGTRSVPEFIVYAKAARSITPRRAREPQAIWPASCSGHGGPQPCACALSRQCARNGLPAVPPIDVEIGVRGQKHGIV